MLENASTSGSKNRRGDALSKSVSVRSDSGSDSGSDSDDSSKDAAAKKAKSKVKKATISPEFLCLQVT